MRLAHFGCHPRRFVLALFLLGAVVQQLGAFTHTGMLARAALGGSMLGEICTSLATEQQQGDDEPAKRSAEQARSCDLCSAATAASLLCTNVDVATALPTINGQPLASVFALKSSARRAYLSRAPPNLRSA